MVKVVVFIRGGNVEGVQCNDTDAVIRIVDFDNKSDDGSVDHSEADWFWPNTQINEDFDKYMADIDEDFPNGDDEDVMPHYPLRMHIIFSNGDDVLCHVTKFDEANGTLQVDYPTDITNPEGIIREFIDAYDDDSLQYDRYDVCTKCHAHTLRSVIVEDETGKGLHEEKMCPECDKK